MILSRDDREDLGGEGFSPSIMDESGLVMGVVIPMEKLNWPSVDESSLEVVTGVSGVVLSRLPKGLSLVMVVESSSQDSVLFRVVVVLIWSSVVVILGLLKVLVWPLMASSTDDVWVVGGLVKVPFWVVWSLVVMST